MLPATVHFHPEREEWIRDGGETDRDKTQVWVNEFIPLQWPGQYRIQLQHSPTHQHQAGKTEPSSPSTNNLRAEVNEVRAANVRSSQVRVLRHHNGRSWTNSGPELGSR